MTREEAVQKVEKLLRLTSSTEEGEVNNAIRLAQKLMAEFHISEDSIGESKEEDTVRDILDPGTKTTSSNYKMIIFPIVEHFRCKCFYDVYKGRIIVLGYKDDVAIVKRVAAYAYKAYQNLADKYVKTKGDISRSQKTAVKNLYCSGFVFGIQTALEESTKCYALVLATPLKVQEAYDKVALHKAPQIHRRSSGDPEDFVHGQADGKRAFANQKAVV